MPSGDIICYRATYTKDAHKKLRHNRKWLDGFLKVTQQSAVLLSEDGAEVSVTRLPPGLAISADDGEELKIFGGSIVVCVDAEYSAQELPGASAAGSAPAAKACKAAAHQEEGENASSAANRPVPAWPAFRPGGRAALAGRGGRGGRGGFVPPRAAQLALQDSPQERPGLLPAAVAPQRAQATRQPGPGAPACPAAAHGQPLARQPAAPRAAQAPMPSAPAQPSVAPGERTAEDVLRMLMGQMPQQAPAAKKARVESRTSPGAARAMQQHLQRGSRWEGYGEDSADEAEEDAPLRQAPGQAASKWASHYGGGNGEPLPQRSRWAPSSRPALPAREAAGQEVRGPQAGMGGGSSSGLEGCLDEDGGDVWGQEGPVPSGLVGPRVGGRLLSASARDLVSQQAAAAARAPAAQRWSQQPQPGAQASAALEARQQETPASRWAQPQLQGQPVGQPGQMQPGRQPPLPQQQPGPVQPPGRLMPPVSQLGLAGRPPQSGRPAGAGFQQPRALPQPGLGKAAPAGQAGAGVATPAAPDPGELAFVGAAEGGPRLLRRAMVPDRFSSGQEYGRIWKQALMEELNLKMAEVAQSFRSACARLQSGRHDGGSGGGPGGPPGLAGLEGKLRQSGVHYHTCELFIWKNLPGKGKQAGKKGRKRGKGGADEDEDEEPEESGQKPESLYLIIKSGRGKYSDYRKDDLWVISNSPQFQSGFAPGQVGDKTRAPWVAIARSLWHGPNQDGKFEVELLSPRPPGLGRSQPVHAIRAVEASTELSMIDMVQGLTAQSLPLLPHLLGRPACAAATGAAGAAPACTQAGPAAAQGAAAGQGGSCTPQAGASAPSGSSSESPSYSPTDSEASDWEVSRGKPGPLEGAPADADAAGGSLQAPSAASDEPGSAAPQPKRARGARERAGRGRGGTGGTADGEGEGGTGEDCRQSAAEDARELIAQFGLNVEQAAVVQQVASWCRPEAQAAPAPPPPICLIHGPFGSGKSTLLVAIIHLLLRQRTKPGGPLASARILVSAHTNVAVDRVLLGLLESGCTDFLRVGPLRRISRGLLRQSLHCSESKAHASAASELKEMLKEASDPHEAAVLRAELEAAEKGADRQKKRLLKTVPVVGVTCCSALLAALDGHAFDCVVLDECSQMVEPLSLVPLVRARCRYLIAAGDPLQLPPVIASPAQVTAPPAGAPAGTRPHPSASGPGGGPGGAVHGLLRPLFVRLGALGHKPHLLRRQYRCHPDLAAVPNQLFYGGRLLDGCARSDRPSLLPGLPNLVVLDVRGLEQYAQGSRSATNPREAAAVAAVVQRLLAAGVRPGQCGVICFFRAQVALIRSMLDKQLPLWLAQQRQGGAPALGIGATAALGERPGIGGDRRAGAGEGGGEESSMDEEWAAGEGDCASGEEAAEAGIQVATVDSFQGAERDVIILSTTVTRPGSFAADPCRLNVALTRAKCNLVVVGCAPALQQSAPAFAALLRRARGMPGGYGPQGRLPQPAAAVVTGGALQLEATTGNSAAAGRELPGGASAAKRGAWAGDSAAAAPGSPWEGDGGGCEEEWEALEAAVEAGGREQHCQQRSQQPRQPEQPQQAQQPGPQWEQQPACAQEAPQDCLPACCIGDSKEAGAAAGEGSPGVSAGEPAAAGLQARLVAPEKFVCEEPQGEGHGALASPAAGVTERSRRQWLSSGGDSDQEMPDFELV